MRLRSVGGFVLFGVAISAWAAHPKACVSADEASRRLNKDVCISAHVYEIVQLSDGTRFMDVCTPETSDEGCRFTIVSFWEDREEVGELRKYRDMDVQVRGSSGRCMGEQGWW